MCIPRKLRRKQITENNDKANNRQSTDQSKTDTETLSIQTNEFKKGCASRCFEWVCFGQDQKISP